ncbi:DUF7448 domain-containing protein [Ralstonia pseudosolanacearum]
MGYTAFATLLGLTLTSIEGLEVDSEVVTLRTECGRTFRMYHRQDCCESVAIADVTGDAADLIGEPILRAEEATSDASDDSSDSSGTWTFYKLATRKGYVDIRWLGESNGYYSEAVDFEEVK